jgi:hypothetical protein
MSFKRGIEYMTLLVAGDVMLAAGIDRCIQQVTKNVCEIKVKFRDSRLIANLECPVCLAPIVEKNGFRADPKKCDEVLRLFDVLSIANNHALDCGDDGVRETVHNLLYRGVAVVGYRGTAELQKGAVLSIAGTKVGLLGYVDEALFKNRPSTILATCNDWAKVKSEIQLLRQSTDIVLCMLHAGREMVRCPTATERELVIRFLEGGVNIVVRSHAHVVQGYEQINTSLAFYGLGDFVFDAAIPRRRTFGVVLLNGDPLGSEWQPFFFHREGDYTIRRLQGRSLSGVPTAFNGLWQAVDKTCYYGERAVFLLEQHGLGGILYGIRRLFGLRNNRRMV